MRQLAFKERKLYFENREIFEFPLEVWKFIDAGDKIFVLFNAFGYTPDPRVPDNIYCIDIEGKVRWKVQEHVFESGDHYTSLDLVGEKIFAQTVRGFKCTIEPDTGKIVGVLFNKF